MNFRKRIAAGILLALAGLWPAAAAPSFQQIGNTLVMSNANVRLQYDLTAGTTDFYWQNSKKISGFYSGFSLDTGYIKGISYSSWSYAVSNGNQAVVTATGSGLPVMRQYFTLNRNDSFLLRVEVSGSNLKANWMGPVVVDSTGGVDIGITNDNRALVVPFDNDGFVRYNAMPMSSSGNGYEVGAFYDNTTRNGLVVGSVTHDTWKTGIFFVGANNKLNALNVYGGATMPADVSPHGFVGGNTVASPTMFVGFGPDWRVTLQNYAAENTNVVARLAWTNGVPFGWNSYGVIQQNITYTDAVAVSDYYYTNLMNRNFTNHGTVYINFDSFWDNLSGTELQNFVNHCHAHGQKAGIYWGPFVFWGTVAQGSNWLMSGSSYNFSDAYLRTADGSAQTLDGAVALDPTHPGTKQIINYYINEFTNWGFDYIKLDFLSHAALEGVHHDANVTTGMQAYNQGMQYLLNAINGRMFISESIAPLFPYQYGHSRRIACDAETSLIGDTEYTMNSVSYGWWLNGVYQFNDPDIMVFANGANANEAQSRLISGAVTGIFLDGDDLTTASGQIGSQPYMTNAAINDVARAGRTFTPVEGNTGSSAVNTFVRQDGATWCIAVFNYGSSTANRTVDLNRAGLPPGNYLMTNLWDGTTATVSGSFNVSLNAEQSKLFRLAARNPATLRWNSGNPAWDIGTSANWLNVSNSQQTVFLNADSALFDDAPGVATNITLSGPIFPGVVTVNSGTNNFQWNGPGKISGSVGLTKSGASTLTLNATNDFTGPVAIGGGTIQAGAGALDSVASLTITNGGTLDLNGNAIAGNKAVFAAGTGTGGNGVIYNGGGDFYSQVFNLNLAGDVTLGGNHRWDLASGSAISGPHNVTLKMAGGYAEWDTVTLGSDVGDIEIAQGAFGIKGMGNSFGNPAATLIVDTEVDFWNSSFGANSGYARNIHVQPNAAFKVLTSPNTYFNANVTLEDGANWNYFYGSGSQTMNGAYTLNGVAHLITSDSTVIFSNVISGHGGLIWDGNNHQAVFAASNTYSGPTVIGSGMTLALTGNGSISRSTNIFFGGTDFTIVHLDAGGRPDKTLTLAGGQTLGGIGRLNGSLTVSPGAVLSPAGTNTTLGITTGSNAIGTISATNAIVLNGTTCIKLNGPGTNDVIQSGAAITYGGTLNLINLSATALKVGDAFQIFNAAGYNGSFITITPAVPGPGLLWDTTQLNAGKLKVIAVPPAPVINEVKMLAGNLVFGGTNGTATNNYVLLTSTDVNTPRTNWTPLATNTFDLNGAFHVTNLIVPGTLQRFYCIQPR
ncbi:MAG TPA: autotransporter-associated beta strand repeat-containing protein [Candidatus Acidoferrales bacterium]|nr:autotransporter-associated beta strand repeat-containing protein [Candidatus Acidoferrales bacterium]